VFIRIVQISNLATACVGQPLLIFWSHIEQSWMLFALIVAALKMGSGYRYAVNLEIWKLIHTPPVM